MRRGQRLVARADVESAAPLQLFLDVYRVTDQGLEHVASADRDRTSVNVDIHRDAEYVVRLQPELLRDARVTILWQGEPTLSLPVEGANRSSIQSYFLAPRDGGRREHHGVDIFAPRGTPVVAAAGGLVASVADNRLGGRVVWVVRPRAGERHYYAHLDEQLVSPGTPVDAGDVLGTVGTTGNARGGPPHLHFGIYTGGGPVDPLPYLAPAAPVPAIGGEYRLGTLARLRRDKTPVRIVGALPLQLRVALPDGTERLVAATDVEAAVRPLRVIRVTAPMTLRSNAIDGVAMETVSPPSTLRVLGTFAGAALVEQPDGRRGWIASS
jgi:hypothetical protein